MGANRISLHSLPFLPFVRDYAKKTIDLPQLEHRPMVSRRTGMVATRVHDQVSGGITETTPAFFSLFRRTGRMTGELRLMAR